MSVKGPAPHAALRCPRWGTLGRSQDVVGVHALIAGFTAFFTQLVTVHTTLQVAFQKSNAFRTPCRSLQTCPRPRKPAECGVAASGVPSRWMLTSSPAGGHHKRRRTDVLDLSLRTAGRAVRRQATGTAGPGREGTGSCLQLALTGSCGVPG